MIEIPIFGLSENVFVPQARLQFYLKFFWTYFGKINMEEKRLRRKSLQITEMFFNYIANRIGDWKTRTNDLMIHNDLRGRERLRSVNTAISVPRKNRPVSVSN